MEFSRHILSSKQSSLDDTVSYSVDMDNFDLCQFDKFQCQGLETKQQVATFSEVKEHLQHQDFGSINSFTYDVTKQNESPVNIHSPHPYSQSIQLKNDYIFNPIAESEEYRAYRARQEVKDFYIDKKWPSVLDNFFLDAMIDIPIMGKKKFNFNGKLHGHNQMISIYVWIAYKESLPPNVVPDPSMFRSRKQISSHIQVLKKLLQGNTAFKLIFSKDSLEKCSVDDNPCLISLSQGRLPSKAYRELMRNNFYRKLCLLESQNLTNLDPDVSVKPEIFFLKSSSKYFSRSFIVNARSAELHSNNLSADKFRENLNSKFFINGAVMTQMKNDNLESIIDCYKRFPPIVAALQSSLGSQGKQCEIIHTEVSIDFNLLSLLASRDDDVLSQCGLVLSISRCIGLEDNSQFSREWRSISTLTEPQELYRDSKSTSFLRGLEVEVSQVGSPRSYDSSSLNVQVLAPIPAPKFASMLLSSLSPPSIHNQQDLSCFKSSTGPNESGISSIYEPIFRSKTHTEMLKFSVYQELISKERSSQGGFNITKLAIILWSFNHHPMEEDIQNLPIVSWRRLLPPNSTLSVFHLPSPPASFDNLIFEQQQQQQFPSKLSRESNIGQLTLSLPTAPCPSHKSPSDPSLMQQYQQYQSFSNVPQYEIYSKKYQNSSLAYSDYTPIFQYPASTKICNSSAACNNIYNDNQKNYNLIAPNVLLHQFQAQLQTEEQEQLSKRSEL